MRTLTEEVRVVVEGKMTAVEKVAESKPTRWRPTDLFDQLQDEMNRMWGSWQWPTVRPLARPATGLSAWAPKMDVFEKNEQLVVKTELPGVNKADIHVTIDDGALEIRGERKEESEVKEQDYYRCERSYGSFYRRMPLPAEVDASKIEASFKDGVLEIAIPRPAEKKSEGKRIAVK